MNKEIEIVLNKSFGCFSLSNEAMALYIERKYKCKAYFYDIFNHNLLDENTRRTCYACIKNFGKTIANINFAENKSFFYFY